MRGKINHQRSFYGIDFLAKKHVLRHRFYQKSKREQHQIQLWIGLGAFTVLLAASFISWITGIYLIGFLIFPITLSMIAPFFDTPALKKSGKLMYHSSLFLSEKPKDGLIKIHGGTLFDYVFVLDPELNSRQRTNIVLQQYLEGLLCLIEQYDGTENIMVSGTSYIINKRTAERVGFTVTKTDALQKMILMVNYFNVLTSYSIAKGKLSFPKLNATKTFEAKMDELVERKQLIGDLNEKLKRSITT